MGDCTQLMILKDPSYRIMGEKTRSSTSKITIASLLHRLSIHSNPFKSLAKDVPLLILSPYLQHPPPTVNPSISMDPFENFARSLVKFHPHVWHVPYVANRAMSQQHKQQIAEAGGVIVIMCATNDTQSQESAQLDAVMYQQRFAKDVASMTSSYRKPSMLLLINLPVYDGERFNGTLELMDWNELDSAASIIYEADSA
jgi:hypothetical protein